MELGTSWAKQRKGGLILQTTQASLGPFTFRKVFHFKHVDWTRESNPRPYVPEDESLTAQLFSICVLVFTKIQGHGAEGAGKGKSILYRSMALWIQENNQLQFTICIFN